MFDQTPMNTRKFQDIEAAPPDAILGITEAFQADPNPHKINLSVGQYKDDQGATPVFNAVHKAEQMLVAERTPKGYLRIDGHTEFHRLVPQLVCGDDSPLIADRRVATIQTPGGTGALRVAADLIAATLPGGTVWISQPTWPNHLNIFAAAGLQTASYPYYDNPEEGLKADDMLHALSLVPSGDFVVLQGCCHNPSGIDLQPEHWKQLTEMFRKNSVTPIIDVAYQGFGKGIEQDAQGLRQMCQGLDQAFVCSSFSKNFGLYGERIGGLLIVADCHQTVEKVTSQAKKCIRSNYSNPPAHGAQIVAKILGDTEMRSSWQLELNSMRERIATLRQSFVQRMNELDSPVDFSFIGRQQGMFSFSGFSPDQVAKIQRDHSIYIVSNGRINVAGLQARDIDRICQAILSVLT